MIYSKINICSHRAYCLAFLMLIILLLPITLIAAPIEYRFSWVGSGTNSQLFQNLDAQMQFEGKILDVITSDQVAVAQNMTGNFTSDLITGQIADLEVVNRHLSGGSSLSFGTLPAGTPLEIETELLIRDPAIDGYDLRSSIDLVTTSVVGVSDPFILDFGDAGSISYSEFDSATFQATTSGSDDISYTFSWDGSGAYVVPFSNLFFEMTFLADTDGVITSDQVAVAQNMTGNFTSDLITGQIADLEVVNRHLSGGSSLSFGTLPAGTPLEIETELLIRDPAIDGYDLRSSIDLVTTSVAGVSDPFILDFGDAGSVSFSEISSVTFQASELQPVPEPATILLLGTGLVGLAGFGRKKFFKK